MNLNCRSLCKNINDIEMFLMNLNQKPDICFFTETWLTHKLVPPRYEGLIDFYQYCQERRGGGVSLFISNQYTILDVNPCLSQTFDSIGKIVSKNNVSYLILCINRPPNSNTETFLHDVEANLSQLSIQYYVSHWIIGSNFNIDLFAKSNYADSFINILMCYNMFPIIFQSTHPSSGTLIDNMFISWPGMINSRILSVDVFDHIPTITRIKQDNGITTYSNVVCFAIV